LKYESYELSEMLYLQGFPSMAVFSQFIDNRLILFVGEPRFVNEQKIFLYER